MSTCQMEATAIERKYLLAPSKFLNDSGLRTNHVHTSCLTTLKHWYTHKHWFLYCVIQQMSYHTVFHIPSYYYMIHHCTTSHTFSLSFIAFIPLLRNQRRKIHKLCFSKTLRSRPPNLPQQSRHRLMQALSERSGDGFLFHTKKWCYPWDGTDFWNLILKEIRPSHFHKNSSNIAISAHGLKLLRYLKQQWPGPTSFKRYESLITPNILFVQSHGIKYLSGGAFGKILGLAVFHSPSAPNPPASLVTEPNRTWAGKRESLVMRMSGARLVSVSYGDENSKGTGV